MLPFADLAGIARGGGAPEEKHDDVQKIEADLDKLADLLREARDAGGAVLHAGAGISTAAAIPDFRGPKGVWVLQAQKQELEASDYGTEFEDALPTLSHMAVVALLRAGYLRHIVSQNVDGLFLRAGVPKEQLSELHGNVYLERCSRCKKRFLREFDAAADGDDSHFTGRRCDVVACKARLLDSIVDFGEDLPEDDLQLAEVACDGTSLSLVVGTSLTVTPASLLPKRTLARRNAGMREQPLGHLAIVNLQATYLDDRATVRSFAKSDQVFAGLMTRLGLPIPSFDFRTHLFVGTTATPKQKQQWSWQVVAAGECGYASRFLAGISARIVPVSVSEIKSVHIISPRARKPAKRSKQSAHAGESWVAASGEGDGLFEIQGDIELVDNKAATLQNTAFEIEILVRFAEICGKVEPALCRHEIRLVPRLSSSASQGPEDLFVTESTHSLHVRTVDYNANQVQPLQSQQQRRPDRILEIQQQQEQQQQPPQQQQSERRYPSRRSARKYPTN